MTFMIHEVLVCIPFLKYYRLHR